MPVTLEHGDDDRFYLVSEDQTLAFPMPLELHGHMGELMLPADERLGCFVGFVPWEGRE